MLFEALAQGVPVLSYDRGSIAEQIGEAGAILPREGDFVAFALTWLRDQQTHPEKLQTLQSKARAVFDADRRRARDCLNLLFDDHAQYPPMKGSKP